MYVKLSLFINCDKELVWIINDQPISLLSFIKFFGKCKFYKVERYYFAEFKKRLDLNKLKSHLGYVSVAVARQFFIDARFIKNQKSILNLKNWFYEEYNKSFKSLTGLNIHTGKSHLLNSQFTSNQVDFQVDKLGTDSPNINIQSLSTDLHSLLSYSRNGA